MDNNEGGVSSFRGVSIRVNAVDGVKASPGAIGFHIAVAVLAVSARAYVISYPNGISHLEPSDIGADFLNHSGYLVSVRNIPIQSQSKEMPVSEENKVHANIHSNSLLKDK